MSLRVATDYFTVQVWIRRGARRFVNPCFTGLSKRKLEIARNRAPSNCMNCSIEFINSLARPAGANESMSRRPRGDCLTTSMLVNQNNNPDERRAVCYDWMPC